MQTNRPPHGIAALIFALAAAHAVAAPTSRAQGTPPAPPAAAAPSAGAPGSAPPTPTAAPAPPPAPAPAGAPAYRPGAAPSPSGPARRTLALSLKDALVRGLANNPDLEISRLSIRFARVGPDVPDGAFDPVYFFSGSLARSEAPFFSRNPFAGLPPGLVKNPVDSTSGATGLRFRSRFGTTLELRYDVSRRDTENVFALNPSYSPAATASVTQPLLKGLSPSFNLAAIEIARNDARVSEEAFRDSLLTLALSIEEAYWTYVFTLENLKVAELSLETARQLFAINKQKFDVGKVPEIDVLIAESGVASREEAVIVARNDILNARDGLFRLILPQGAGRKLAGEEGGAGERREATRAWDVDLVPLDQPRIDEAPVDVAKALETAFAQRPDYQQLVINLESDELRIQRAWHDRLPRLDATGSYSQLGLGKSWGNAAKVQVDDDFHEWAIGITLEVPIFNTTPRAQYEQAETARAQTRKRVESLEQAILLDVRTAARNLEAAHQRVRATDVARKLAERQLENEKKRLEAGLSTNYDVLLSEQNLTTARSNFLKAHVDRAVARARLERATATLLERHDVRVDAP
jgi:outer membrane protein TolC